MLNNKQKLQQKAFKFYKNEVSYPNIRRVMQKRTPPENERAYEYASIMKKWFEGPHVRRGNLTQILYRGVPFHPKGKTLTNRSFVSWTPNLVKALRFVAGSRSGKSGVILVMNGREAPAYVRYNAGPPTYFNRVGGNTESEILLPPGRMTLGNKTNAIAKVKVWGNSKNIPYTSVRVTSYKGASSST